MASMLDSIGNVELVKILDAGAGEGILTTSAARRCLELGNRRVHAILFEIDKQLSTLEKNMDRLVGMFLKKVENSHMKFTTRISYCRGRINMTLIFIFQYEH